MLTLIFRSSRRRRRRPRCPRHRSCCLQTSPLRSWPGFPRPSCPPGAQKMLRNFLFEYKFQRGKVKRSRGTVILVVVIQMSDSASM
jgi:hypothetical protein